MAHTSRQSCGILPRAARALAPGLFWAALLAAFFVPGTRANPARPPRAPTLLPLSASSAAPALRPATGRFLVASRGMRDPRFSQTVILLVEHGLRGTRGLIVNRRTEVTLDTALPEIAKEKGASIRLFWGGPVQVQAMSLLVRSKSALKGTEPVLDGVHFGASLEALEAALAGETGAARLRVFAGFAGWAPGQLAHELVRGDWHVMDARPGEVFHAPSPDLWSVLIRRAEAEWVWLPGERPAG